jgi:hypothetical protein
VSYPTDPTAANRTLPVASLPVPFQAAPSPFPVGTSRWWLDRLVPLVRARRDRMIRLQTYYRGEQSTQRLASRAFVDAGLLGLFPNLRANHARLIVNASAQRLVILGYRLAGELRADVEAARLWRANGMDTLGDVANTEALVKGECPVLVEPNPRDPSTPIITPQLAEEVAVWHAGSDKRIRLAAVKTWWDYDQRRRLYVLYLPDRVETWRDSQPSDFVTWALDLFGRQPSPYEFVATSANPLGEVPMVVVPNEPLLSGSPMGEHEGVLDLIDLYNKTLMDLAATSHEMAFPQRYGTGVDDAEEAAPVGSDAEARGFRSPETRSGQGRMLTTPAPDAAFGQFAAAELANYTGALAVIRNDEATITATPYHYLLAPSSIPPSGESITAAEVPLVDKVRSHGRDKGAAWRDVMRLAFRIAGDETRARAMAAGVVVWSDPERHTESQHMDALGKQREMLGAPLEAVWEQIPIPPEEIDRWRRMLEEEAAAAPAPAGGPGAPGGAIIPGAPATSAPGGGGATNATA